MASYASFSPIHDGKVLSCVGNHSGHVHSKTQCLQCGGCIWKRLINQARDQCSRAGHHLLGRSNGRKNHDAAASALVSRMACGHICVSLFDAFAEPPRSRLYPFHERENLTHPLGAIVKEERRNPFQALIRMLL